MQNISSNHFISHYLDRISITGSLRPNLYNLKKVVKAHVQHIPFEYTWDPMDKSKKLELDTLFTKIVLFKSGGYCYETGLLFNHFLKTIGFNTQLITGQIYRKGTLDFTSLHLAIVVKMDSDWLVDISWNGGISAPIALRKQEQYIKNKIYKINAIPFGLDVWEKEKYWKRAYCLSFLGDPLKIMEQKHLFHQFDKRSEFYGKHILKYAK